MKITEDQASVYEILTNVFGKLVSIICVWVAFFIILARLLKIHDKQEMWIFTAFEGILGGTIYLVLKHYFPAIKAAAKKGPVKK